MRALRSVRPATKASPGWRDGWQATSQWEAVDGQDDVGSFPWDPAQLSAPNFIAVHSRILRAVAQLLGTEELMLTQSGGGAKRGANGHEQPRLSGSSAGFGEVGDQPMHKDYGNNIVLVPGIDTPPEAVNCILYLSDVSDCGGATGFVPYTPDLYDIDDGRHVNSLGPHTRYSLPRGHGQPGALYATERLVNFRPGTAFLYRQDTWHRGSCMVAGAVRRTHHMVWRRLDAPWVQYGGPWHGASPEFLCQLSPWERSAIGWPLPGNRYWTASNCAAVAKRYPGVDMAPYLNSMAALPTARL